MTFPTSTKENLTNTITTINNTSNEKKHRNTGKGVGGEEGVEVVTIIIDNLTKIRSDSSTTKSLSKMKRVTIKINTNPIAFLKILKDNLEIKKENTTETKDFLDSNGRSHVDKLKIIMKNIPKENKGTIEDRNLNDKIKPQGTKANGNSVNGKKECNIRWKAKKGKKYMKRNDKIELKRYKNHERKDKCRVSNVDKPGRTEIKVINSRIEAIEITKIQIKTPFKKIISNNSL